MKLKIYHDTWDIKEVNQEALKKFMEDQEATESVRYWGGCSTEGNDILILKDLSPQRKKAVVVHEVVHAIRSMELVPGGDLDQETHANWVAFHLPEINRVVKEYFKPKGAKKRAGKDKEVSVKVPKMSAPEPPLEV